MRGIINRKGQIRRHHGELYTRKKQQPLCFEYSCRYHGVYSIRIENDYPYRDHHEKGPGMLLEPGTWWQGERFELYYRFSKKKIVAGEVKSIKKAGH